jgi:recombination protein RecT
MSNEIIAKERHESIIESVQARISEMSEQGTINFPPNYSVSNALRSAWLTIKETKDMQHRPALSVCTKESVCNALLNTVIQGLNPAKKQIYYIVYGDQLQAQRSYFGTMAAVKRVPGVKSIISDVVYPKDTFVASKENGCWKVVEHNSLVENIDPENFTYAYCTIISDDGEYTEIMTRSQIERSWSKSRSKEHTVHKEFPDQMAKKTVISRACKFFLNSSDDSDMLIEAFNQTDDRIVDDPPKKDSRLEALNEILELDSKVENTPVEDVAYGMEADAAEGISDEL